MSSVCPSLDYDDRISNLPEALKRLILERMPIHDAARTSILSKTWRKTWTTQPCLAFDKLFFLQVVSKKNEEEHLSAFSELIDKILWEHTGPIWDFQIYIPPKLDYHYIHQWIEHVSKQGVKVFKLYNSENDTCLLPSYFFDCANLTELRLQNWILSPPHNSGSFAYLIRVVLRNISISAHISLGTRLQDLALYACTGIEHLDITNCMILKRLVICGSSKIDWRWLESTQLELLILALPPANFNMSKSVDLSRLLSNCPKIHTLFLFDSTLECLGQDHSMLRTHTAKMVNLKKLYLSRVSYNLGRISNSICLIRNLPNLQQLCVTLNFNVKTASKSEKSAMERHLKSPDWKDVLLDKLLAVHICGVVGLRSVFYLTKILLASSPSLRELSLYCSPTIRNPNEKLRIKQRLLQLPRRSLEAQVLWFD